MVWLKKEEDIVVRRADKGGATVIWGKNDYIMEAQKQLNNRQYYVPLKSNPTENIKRDLFAILNPALENKWINKNEFEFLSPSNPKLATFYLLPKIHKNLHSPPGRPIINGIDTITEPASQYIDFVIKPLTMSLKAYLQDTTHILKDLQEMQQAPNAILATMDVESLYSNIDHQEGLEALEHFLQKRSNTETPPTQFVVSLTQWSLNNNIFLFQDRLYQQTKGTAMGASYAPNYAGLFLGLWEERYVHSTENPFKQLIKYYGRYIDDLFFIFTGTTEQLQEFHQYLNSTNPNIKLSLEFSNKEINFLDLLISLDEQGSIHTSLFRKSTDRNTVLHAESFHPKSLIENIPFGQFQRLKRICNSQTDFNTQATEMQQRFVQRGYKAKTLSGALTRVKTLDRRNLLIRRQRAPSQTKNRIFCTLQYSNMAHKIKNAITKNWSIL
uniref:Reverse transcriptase domain-containing protein n=1 Tax=Amphiprion percula TaxID=161767 RepID=A0A3P8U3H0_AMPPE